MIFQSINPFSKELIAEHEVLSNAQLKQKLELAESAFKNWRHTSFQERADKMKKLANILREKKQELGLLITSEMGKILPEGIAEVEKCAANCDFYAENAEKMLQDEHYDTPFKSMSVYDPMGAVFAIMPWNYPFWQVLRYAAPAIMGGNVTLLKHAPNVIGCAKAIENAFLEAGFPEGVFQQIAIDIPQVEAVIASNIVCGITLTGSEMAGSSVASLAGKHIKKSVMELGGSDAFIVLNDADLEKAATVATQSRMLNAGQACICAKRFIVVEKVADEFAALFTQKVSVLNQGNPLLEGINMGPLARLDLAEKLSGQLEKSLRQGAKLVIGGEQNDCNFQPTLIDFVDSNNIAFQEETFGPLAPIFKFSSEAEAIEMANDTPFGLAAYFYSQNIGRIWRVAEALEYGMVGINEGLISNEVAPFGGVKESGLGREGSQHGIEDYLEMKYLCMGGIKAVE